MSYGFLINNGVTTRAFTNGYKALNFVTAGISRPLGKGYLTYFDFRCDGDPVLFYRSAQVDNYTAPHYTVRRGTNSYRAYCMGEAEIFVFAKSVTRSNEPYGLQIFSERGELVYQGSDTPIKVVTTTIFPGLKFNTKSRWNASGSYKKLAYSLGGNCMAADIDTGTKQADIYRNVVESHRMGFTLHFMKVFSGNLIKGDFDGKTGFRFGAVTEFRPESELRMLVVDVTNINYSGMLQSTRY